MVQSDLAKAIHLIEAGHISAGRNILLDLLQIDEQNELAWLWLSKTYSDNRVEYCLRKVLEINPLSQPAKAELKKFQRTSSAASEAVEVKIIPDGKLVFIPDATSLYLLRLFPLHLIVAFIIISITTWNGRALFGYLIVLIYLLVVAAFCLRVMSPFYHIEVYDEHLVAPTRVSGGMKRLSTPLSELMLENLEHNYRGFGFYSLYTAGGQRILLAGFRERQYLEMLDVIRGRIVI